MSETTRIAWWPARTENVAFQSRLAKQRPLALVAGAGGASFAESHYRASRRCAAIEQCSNFRYDNTTVLKTQHESGHKKNENPSTTP